MRMVEQSRPNARLMPAERSIRRPLHLGFLVLATALLIGCCPVPAATAADTSFIATVASVAQGAVTVSLGNQRQVRLVPRREAGQFESLAVGQRVHVEGALEGEIVLVERLTVLVLAGSPGAG